MRRWSIAVIAAVSTMVCSQLALAADLPVKAPAYVPPPPQDWSGVYVGFEGGYGWGKQDLNALFPGANAGGGLVFPDIAFQFGSQKGWLLGGFAGAQRQWGSFVFGVETDFDAPNPFLDPTTKRSDKTWTGGVIVDTPITQWFGVKTTFQYDKTMSTLPNFRMDNFSVLSGPTARF